MLVLIYIPSSEMLQWSLVCCREVNEKWRLLKNLSVTYKFILTYFSPPFFMFLSVTLLGLRHTV